MRLLFNLRRPRLERFRVETDAGMVDIEGTPLLIKGGEAIPDGARWITVHPPGHDKGQPVLIQETEKGSGTYHVIGGAGGKLNYLRLRGVKSREQYAGEVRGKQGEKRAAAKEQRQREKDAGTYESAQAERGKIKEGQRAAEKKFIQTVAKHAGWSEEDMKFPEEKVAGLSEPAQKKAFDQHHRELLGRARAAADLQQKALTAAADTRLAEALDEPSEAAPPPAPGLGYQPNYGERTKDQAESIQAEAGAVNAGRSTDEQRARAATVKQRAQAIKAELEKADINPGPLKAQVLETAAQFEVLKARKELQKSIKQARAAGRAVDRGEQKAFVLEVSKPTDEEVQQDVANDLRTVRTRAFLSEVASVAGGMRGLGGHIATGAYNGLNGIALGVSASSLIDRDTVDVLGIAGAAQALAARMRADMPPAEFGRALRALEAYHVDHYMQRSEDALREASELEGKLKEMQLPEVAGSDLGAAHELNQRRKSAIADVQKMLGQSLGEMEANAALLVAMQSKTDQDAKVPLGTMGTEAAIQRLRAIGLEQGDYSIEHAGSEVIATVSPDGLRRVAAPMDREHAEAVRESLAIMTGERDDPDFWPEGIARRPDLAVPPPEPAVAAALSRPFQAGADLPQSMRDYIGGRMADGHAISDIVGDLQSEDLARTAGDRREDYFKALDEVVPLAGKNGKPIEAQARRAEFEKHADDFVTREHGGQFQPIHAQTFDMDHHAIEALHRAFAENPAGPLAFRAVGDLTPQNQGALRDYFAASVAPPDAEGADLRAQLDKHGKAEPDKEVEDMFGRGTNPAWTAWNSEGASLRDRAAKTGLDWKKYTTAMGSPQAAYRAVQDHLLGRVVGKFHEEHGKLSGKSLKLGRTVISNHLRHVEAVDPAVRERRAAEARELADRLRNRAGGRYASGTVSDKLQAARERQAAAQQSQLGMFAAAPEEAGQRPLEADERPTIGAAAEAKMSQMSQNIGGNYKPGEPVKVWQPGMTGKFAPQQRAVKLVERNRRTALAQGTGSGKTAMMLSSFAHLKSKGKIKRGIFAVPSIVQGQVGAEALSIMEPGKFKWHAEPGASREERLAHYANPETDFSVVTHQAFRDDMMHLGADQAGISDKEMADQVEGMDEAGRQQWLEGVMAAHGMDHDFVAVDEGHGLLNRSSKENSQLANIFDALTADEKKVYINSTADPTKNDVSEAYDLLHKMAPSRHKDRAAFMRRYGVDTAASREQLRRELARYVYAGHIKPDIRVQAKQQAVELSEPQKADLDKVEDSVRKLRLSQLKGKPDLAAARFLSPDSFEGAPEDQHAAIASRLTRSLGILKDTANARIIDAHPQGAKLDEISKQVAARPGKPGVIFARSLDAVKNIAARLKKEGHRVETITGADSSKDKDRKRRRFKPETGNPEADILVLSDAGAVGLGAQRAHWLMQNDTPMTAMTHNQRNGRINRIGQKNEEIELIDMVANHPHEAKARQRMTQKYELRDIMTTPLEKLDDTGFAAYLKRAGDSEQKAMAA